MIELPVLHEIIGKISENEFSDLNLLVVQHLDYCTLAFMRELKRLNFPSISIVAKPHSIDHEVVNQMSELGINVVEPSCSELMTYEPCFRFLQFIQKKCLLSNERYGILDLGGYLVGAFHKAIAEDKFCIGAVEDTKSGLWADQKILELKIPIISVASSNLKTK